MSLCVCVWVTTVVCTLTEGTLALWRKGFFFAYPHAREKEEEEGEEEKMDKKIVYTHTHTQGHSTAQLKSYDSRIR